MTEGGRKVLAVVQSIGVHLLFGLVLVYGLSGSQRRIEPRIPVAIQATVVDREQIVAARAAAEERQTQALREEARARREAQAEADRRAAAEQQERAEQEAERRRRAEETAAAERRRQDQLERERRLADERERQREGLRRQREEAEAERRRIEAEQARLAAERRAQEEQRARELEEQRMQQLLDREAQRLADAQQASLEQQWVAAIRTLVTQNWRRPPSARPGMSCMVRVDQLPGGDVVNAVVLPGCRADEITRRSIIDAVMRSEPLPYRGFEPVFRRQLTFEFRSGEE